MLRLSQLLRGVDRGLKTKGILALSTRHHTLIHTLTICFCNSSFSVWVRSQPMAWRLWCWCVCICMGGWIVIDWQHLWPITVFAVLINLHVLLCFSLWTQRPQGQFCSPLTLTPPNAIYACANQCIPKPDKKTEFKVALFSWRQNSG